MQHLKEHINESILSSTGAGKQHVYKKWLEEHVEPGTKIQYDEKTGTYNLSFYSEINTQENFPAGIKIDRCTIVYASNITTLKGFPEHCDYIQIKDSDITNFEGCPEEVQHICVSNSSIKSLDGFPKYAKTVSIGGNKQHFSANDVKHYCKFKDITTLGVFNYDGMSYFGNGERQYIKDVVKELEAMLKSNIKELRNVDCTIDDKRRIFIRLDFEDNVGFENWPNCKSVSDNPDYHTNNIYTSFVYLPETRTLARFRQGALDTPENFSEIAKAVRNNTKDPVKLFDYPYLANGGKDFSSVTVDFFAKDIYNKIKKYLVNVVDAAKKDSGGTLHRTTETKYYR